MTPGIEDDETRLMMVMMINEDRNDNDDRAQSVIDSSERRLLLTLANVSSKPPALGISLKLATTAKLSNLKLRIQMIHHLVLHETILF